ncbi:MAG: HEAT repeat domain-containing protein [Thermodesulfobacteriota bacterium]
MGDSRGIAKEEEAVAGRPVAGVPVSGPRELLHVIMALNRIRMNVGMYPPGHVRITECADAAFDLIRQRLGEKTELPIGFAGDSLFFGETAPDKERKDRAFQDYARCLNHLRILSFTLHSHLTKQDLVAFSRILSAKPADIWAMGTIESALERAGIRGISVQVIDSDRFRGGQRKESTGTGVGQGTGDERFPRGFLALLGAEAWDLGRTGAAVTEPGKPDPAAAVALLNKERRHWPSAVIEYEKMVYGYFSAMQRGDQVQAQQLQALAGLGFLFPSFHPDLQNQMIDVLERQMALHPETAFTREHLGCFPKEMFRELMRRTEEEGAQISPALSHLLQRMTGSADAPPSPDGGTEADLSAGEMQTLLKREKYEEYVPEAYDRLLKKASVTADSGREGERARFPIDQYLSTLTPQQINLRICRLIHSMMDAPVTADQYAAFSGKLSRSLPLLLQEGQFLFLVSLTETLHRHLREKQAEAVRQSALSLLRSLSERETIARHVGPLIIKGTEKPDELTSFLISGGLQNLAWLFDLYLDPKGPSPPAIVGIMKGFGRSADDEAVKRLSGRDPRTIVRLLALIRDISDRSSVPSWKNLFDHEEWTVRREVLKTLIAFGDPSVTGLLRKSLIADNQQEVLEAVSLACRHGFPDLLGDLTAQLRTFFIPEKAARLNEWIAGELAMTKNPSVIPHLERVAAAWITLSPKRLSRTKAALYRHLHHFPKNQIRRLLQMGRRSRNQEIRASCSKILRKGKN